MENNRRSFFKGLATFVSGVAAAKVASYVPKKEEPKEEVLVTNTITLIGPGGEPYHPLVVRKTTFDDNKINISATPVSNSLFVQKYEPKVRAAKI